MGFIFTLILFAVFFVLNELLKPKNEQEQSRVGLEDFRFPTATEGRPVPLVWGTVRIRGPNVIWYGDLVQEAITQKVKTGIFSSDDVTIGFRYRVGIQFAICRGPGVELLRIWVGEEEAFAGLLDSDGEQATIDKPQFFGGDDLGNGGIGGDVRWYTGTETQTADFYLAGFQDEGGDTPGYRGTAYLVAESFYVGNSTSIKPWAFEVRRIPNGLGLSAAEAELNGGNDANPMNVLYEILTGDEWGLNFPAGDIDVTDFQAAAATLASEGNGFSYVLDRSMELVDLVRELERQIDGVVFLDRRTGKWRVNLARGGYDVDLVPQLTDSELVELQEFSRGAWEDTINHVKVGFPDRSRDYFETFALAQDMANVAIQGGQSNTTVASYPGVRDETLANQLAWRDLRTLSYPLAKAKVSVDRTFWDVNPGEVVAWTNSELGLTKVPMRITKVDLGDMTHGRIVLDLVQDVFEFRAGSFGDPPPTGWTPPTDQLVPFPDDEEVAFEAPYAFVARDPLLPGQRSRVWVSGRYQGDGAVVYDVRTRHAPTNPMGLYITTGTVAAFMLMAELDSALSKSLTAIPETSLDLETANFDAKSSIEAATDDVSEEDIGLNLANLAMIGDPEVDDVEFIGFEGTTDGAGTILQLDNVYRGLLDTTPQDWPAGTPVYLLYVGGGLNDTSFPDTDDVDVKLLPRSVSDQVSEGSAVEEALSFDRRDKRPYPPSNLTVEGVFYDPSANLDEGGSPGADLDLRGLDIGFTRRDWRSPDEVVALETDAASLQGDFPSFNSTEYRMNVIDDPDGSPTLLYTTDWQSASPIELERERVLRHTDGAQPSRLRVEIETRHDFLDPPLPDLEANYALIHDFDVTFDEIGGYFNTGARDSGAISAAYTAPTNGTYTFTIGSDVLSSGVLEARINGGGFSTVISTGMTSGTLAGVTAGDTIEWRHTQATGFDETFLYIDAPSSSSDAYGILIGD